MKPVFNSAGNPVHLGTKVGGGGEGDVFDLPGGSVVAKIYHHALSQQKQQKLRGMVKGCDDQLKNIAAWPTSTLHRGNGEICGFIMPKVAGYEPIHKLYSPAHRKHTFPLADWAFLIHTARNIAAAFASIHSHGHVIGDVNEGGIYVGRNSFIQLIDCDSFQIEIGGSLYSCDVGVPIFTPPEFQQLKSFSGLRRTSNHDNFGLAVLCFHLLFMGRHPFAGVFSGKEDMPIEKAIGDYRFAFSKNAASKKMSPPPNSLPTSVVSMEIAGFFERAFSEDGAKPSGRPSANQWMQALDQMKSSLRTCRTEQMHKYIGSDCPWCTLEGRTGVLFFVATVAVVTDQGTFNLIVVWSEITRVPSPGPAPSIGPDQFKAKPRPIPPDIQSTKAVKVFLAIGVGVAGLALTLVHPILLIGAAIVALVLFFSDSGEAGERQKRKIALTDAESKWREEEQRWNREAGERAFDEEREKLNSLKRDHEALHGLYGEEKQKLHARSREIQLNRFLDNHFIDNATIPRIGPSRKATLASFGIETAADLDRVKVKDIKGFGHVYTSQLMQWKKSIEQKFAFDAAKGVDPAELAALDHRFRQKRAEIERGLAYGPQRLTQIKEKIIERRKTMKPTLNELGQQLAQAKADMSAF